MSSLINLFKRLFPWRIILWFKYQVNFIKASRSYLYDLFKYLKHSKVVYSLNDKVKLQSSILLYTHVIEKGLSFKEIKPGFGKNTVHSLIDLLKDYKSKNYSLSDPVFLTGISSLSEYVEYHRNVDINLDKLKSDLSILCITDKDIPGGTINLKKEEIHSAARKNFLELMNSRYSIRNYDNTPVEVSKIINAVKIAQKAPSSCNRQCSRVHIIEDKSCQKEVLKLQTGNRGFGNLIDKLLIITSDVRVFHGIHERNSGYIDGGIFTGCLVNALHFEGLGSCVLNWSVFPNKDKEIRRITKITDSEIIICIIAVGNIPEQFKVTKSVRYNTEDIVTTV